MRSQDPYSKMVQLMRRQGALNNTPGWGIGQIVQAATEENPNLALRVLFCGVVLEEGQLKVLRGYTLVEGDRCAILPDAGGQSFLILGVMD